MLFNVLSKHCCRRSTSATLQDDEPNIACASAACQINLAHPEYDCFVSKGHVANPAPTTSLLFCEVRLVDTHCLPSTAEKRKCALNFLHLLEHHGPKLIAKLAVRLLSYSTLFDDSVERNWLQEPI